MRLSTWNWRMMRLMMALAKNSTASKPKLKLGMVTLLSHQVAAHYWPWGGVSRGSAALLMPSRICVSAMMFCIW